VQFSPEGKTLYLSAGDLARIKVFAIPLPETPKSSTTHPDLPDDWLPKAITQTGAVSGIQVLSHGKLLFTRSSLTAPNDVFVLRNLREPFDADVLKDLKVEQLSRFSEAGLRGKSLAPGEDFYFQGAEHEIHGWVVKPVGFEQGATKKYPVVLLIHGGPQGAWEDQWSTRWNPQSQCQGIYFGINSDHARCSLCAARLLHGSH
jgi:dipeptidyl aminopeptidase/acylaminoacyl peptidase